MPTGKITAIAAQAHDSQRVNIFVDGDFAIGISLATLAREGLFVGKELDEAGWARLEAAAQAEQAMRAAGRLLDVRPRSVAEIRQRLLRKQFPPEIVEQAIERLGEIGLLDDSAFSRYWVESRQAARPRGRLALRDELRRKGVPRDTIDQALAEADAEAPPDAERARAEQAARAALRRYADCPDRATFQRRLGGFLQRRGFSLDVISPILAILWSELRAHQESDSE